MLLGFCTAGRSIRTSENGQGRCKAALDRAVAGPDGSRNLALD
jgi:hypothetical protein